MDVAELKKRARAARSFEYISEGFTFRCLVPTDLEVRGIYARSENEEVFGQEVTRLALVGWDGVRIEHILPDAPADIAKNGVEFEPSLIDEFFAGRGKLFRNLGKKIINRVNERRAQIEAAEKNSARTSS